MSALLHTFLLTLAVAAAYCWVAIPELSMYSLQAIGYVTLLYFMLKRVKRAKLWHVFPTNLSIETALATFAFLILIGSTGNTLSVLYPLSYIHLFFVVFSSHATTSIILTVEILLFHYALSPSLDQGELVSLITLPLVLLFFLFAKRQHEELVRDRLIIAEESSELDSLAQEDAQVGGFLASIQDKLRVLDHQLSLPVSPTSLRGQLATVRLEIERLQEYLRKRWFMFTNTDQTPSSPYEKRPS